MDNEAPEDSIPRSYECFSILQNRQATLFERQDAFEQLFRLPAGWWGNGRLIPWALGVARRTARSLTQGGTVKDQLDWEDAATRALLIFFDCAPRIAENPGGWLRGAIRNTLLNDLKTLKSMVPLDEWRHDAPPVAGMNPDEEPPTPHELERLRRYDALLKAIGELPAKLRIVAQLHFLEQHSAVDIAQLLRLTPAAVRQRIHRVRVELRKKVGMGLGEE
jgi:RNA polymerase sigma factor (sigma-70 family)